MFLTFSAERLDPQKEGITEEELVRWKSSSKSVWCRSNLFTLIQPNVSFMDLIIQQVFSQDQRTKDNIIYTYAVCDALLDPMVRDSRLYESIIVPRMEDSYKPQGLMTLDVLITSESFPREDIEVDEEAEEKIDQLADDKSDIDMSNRSQEV